MTIKTTPQNLMKLIKWMESGELIYESKMNFTKNGLYIFTVDPSHVSSTLIMIKSDFFDSYDEIGSIGVSLKPLKKKLKELFSNSDIIDISYENDKLVFESKLEKMTLNTIDIDEMKMPFAVTKYGIILNMTSEKNRYIIKTTTSELKSMSSDNQITIDFNDDKVTMKVVDVHGTYEKTLKTELISKSQAQDEDISGHISISAGYFPKIIESLEGEVFIHLIENHPITICQKKDDYMITYVVAPMLEDA